MPSNINAATVFELRLCESISAEFGLPFGNAADLASALARHAKSQNSDLKGLLETQEKRLAASLPTFIATVRTLEGERVESLTSIRWIGNQNKGKRVADVELVFATGVVPISVKSGGPGTERNLGGKSLKETLAFDASNFTNAMKHEVRELLGRWLPGNLVPNSWPKIRSLLRGARDLPEAAFLVRQIGYEYQQKISRALVESISNASVEQRAAFWAFLGLASDPRDEGLMIFEATEQSGSFKAPVSILDPSELRLHVDSRSDKGSLKVTYGGEPLWRINVNFTNGIGCSPVAVRAFLL